MQISLDGCSRPMWRASLFGLRITRAKRLLERRSRFTAMFEELVKAFAFVLEAYVIAGFVFAGAFVLTGVQRVDSEARGSRITFRLLIAPGVAAFWPMLLVRWIRGACVFAKRQPVIPQ